MGYFVYVILIEDEFLFLEDVEDFPAVHLGGHPVAGERVDSEEFEGFRNECFLDVGLPGVEELDAGVPGALGVPPLDVEIQDAVSEDDFSRTSGRGDAFGEEVGDPAVLLVAVGYRVWPAVVAGDGQAGVSGMGSDGTV